MATEKLSPVEYEKLKVYLGLHVDWFFPKLGTNPDKHPLLFLANLEKKSMANARRGLIMAINDIVEVTSDWDLERIADADVKFASHGTFTLSELRRRYSKQYAKVLKRGEIRSDTEYYLLKGLMDSGVLAIHAEENRKIETMLFEFCESPLSIKNV
jgi:hypothetical protein